VAAVPMPDERRDPRFPGALNWLARNQREDGSWGSDIPYIHDRFICTLAALIPLARFGRREADRERVRRGERYLWQHVHLLERDACELVGFELLLPTLVRLASDAGVRVPPGIDVFSRERQEKLMLLPSHLLYSPELTLAHSLEFLGEEVNPSQLVDARGPNGSIGNSPAATAFLLHHVEDEAAVAYLENCLDGDGGSAAPVLEPCETFDALWTAYHHWLGGIPASMLLAEPLRSELSAALAGRGVSLSPSFPVPDADETAVALLLFHEAGLPVEPTALCQFERDDYFVSFPYERHPSTGVNIHVLQALLRYPNYPERDAAIVKVLRFLREARQHDSYWSDKWHISPFYATGRAILALREVLESGEMTVRDLFDNAVEWLLHMQNDDGSWGFYGNATREESAYAILALHSADKSDPRVRQAIVAGRAYLQHSSLAHEPALWIDKCLYCPPQIVDAVIQAAQLRNP
jgi:halimadienyl-diphosphate synthase